MTNWEKHFDQILGFLGKYLAINSATGEWVPCFGTCCKCFFKECGKKCEEKIVREWLLAEVDERRKA